MKNKNFLKISSIYFTAIVLIAVVFIFGHLGLIESDILSATLIQIVVMLAIPLLMYTLLVSKNLKQTFTDTGFKKISKKMILITISLGFILYFLNQFVATIFQSIVSHCRDTRTLFERNLQPNLVALYFLCFDLYIREKTLFPEALQ